MVSNSVEIGNICDLQEGYVNPSQKVPGYFGGGIRWLRAVDLNDAEVFETSRTLSQEGYESAGKSALMFPANSIGISKSGTIGRLGILRKPMCGNRAVINIVPKQSNDLRYIFYSLRMARQSIIAMAVGSVQKNLYVPVLESLTIPWPEQHVRDTIVDIAGSIDDKIAVNTRVNDYLAETALSIWKRCVQQSSEHMTIGEAAKEVITGKTPPTKRTELYGSDYPFITIPDMHGNVWFTSTERCLSEEGNKAQPKKIVNRGTVLVSCIATLGLVGIVSKPSHFNQQINAVVPKRAGEEYFLYCALLSVKQTLLGIGATGSATLNVNKGAFSGIDIPWLDDKSMDEYIQTVRPLFEAIEANSNECLRLTSLRDTLLPKLMSGEIDVSGIEVPMQPNNHLYV